MSEKTKKPETEHQVTDQQETGLAVSATVDETGITAQLTSKKQIFSSIKGSTLAEKTALFRAMNNPDHRISDMINQVISVKDVFAEMIEIAHEETGELEVVPRVVLIDEEGKSYQSVSNGIFGAMKKLIAVFGAPTWETPIKIKIVQINNKKDRRILTFDIA